MKKNFVVKLSIALMLALGTFSQAQEETAIPTVPSTETAQETPAPVAQDADNQASASDNVVEGEVASGESVTPVATGQEGVIYDANVVAGAVMPSDCIGCGQATPMFGNMVGAVGCGCNTCDNGCGNVSYVQPVTYNQPMTYAQPVTYNQPVANMQPATFAQGYVQPANYVDSGCACNSGVAQVAYDQPVYRPAVATINSQPVQPMGMNVVSGISTSIVNPAPAPVVPSQPMTTYAQPAVTTTGCSSCGSGAVTNYAPTMNYAPTTTMNYAPATMNYSSVPQSTIAQPTVVTQPTTVVSGGSSYVGGTSYTPAVSTCNNCPPQRGGRLRGRIFRNR